MADRNVVLALSPRALKIIAARWFLRGFQLSGQGFHGECVPTRNAASRALLLAEFERVWADDDRREHKHNAKR